MLVPAKEKEWKYLSGVANKGRTMDMLTLTETVTGLSPLGTVISSCRQ